MPKGPDDETKIEAEEADFDSGRRAAARSEPKMRVDETAYYAPAARGGGCGGVVLAIAALAILGAIGGAVWYFFLR